MRMNAPLTRGWRGTVMIGAAATALTALRLPPRVWDSLYYEDGWLFLGQWRAMGASSIVEGYGGYLHTIPRLASGVVHALPVTWWGVATTAMACRFVMIFKGRWLFLWTTLRAASSKGKLSKCTTG